jgi:Uma2 family endonuclease
MRGEPMTQAIQSNIPALIPAKFTLEQYHQMIDSGVLDDERVELLNGVIVEMSPEKEPHANRITKGRDYLIGLLGDRAEIREGHPITIPRSNSEPEPDLAVVQPLDEEYDFHHPYPENIFWLIEYSNTSLKKDLEIKSETYATAGISEYWVVNLQTRELVVMRDPLNGKYQSRTILKEGVIYPLAFPEMAIAVSRLLR